MKLYQVYIASFDSYDHMGTFSSAILAKNYIKKYSARWCYNEESFVVEEVILDDDSVE